MKEKFHISFVISILIFLFVLVAGAFVYHSVEGWSSLDSIYFVAVTVTTVGYGDLYPVSETGKIFTIFFSFFGVVFAFYYVSLISKVVFKKHVSKKMTEIKRDFKKDLKKKSRRKK